MLRVFATNSKNNTSKLKLNSTKLIALKVLPNFNSFVKFNTLLLNLSNLCNINILI